VTRLAAHCAARVTQSIVGANEMWFETLTGFPEDSHHQVQTNITLDRDTLKSKVNGNVMTCGRLETPSLGELRDRVQARRHQIARLSVREIVAEVQRLHTLEENAGALFQVASQFNLLEMLAPEMTPEHGVSIYENDPTQGPACAIAAGAGTIFRNYFVRVNGQTGQSADNQIDCLADLGTALGNSNNRLWTMKNGYALASRSGLVEISDRLRGSSDSELDALRQLLRIGVQWRTQVTLGGSSHLVSQAYCSALPVAYCPHDPSLWESFAQLVLEAAYEATICIALLNSTQNGNKRLFLTLLGGGAFGNKIDWITAAIQRALSLYRHADLDVALVSHGSSKPYIRELVGSIESWS
jgi:hypothetical protein